ncbi:MAG TPA: NAD(P)(+) transhydrogenase (Re/Si-specific) subunit alpha, partial [Bauldia sp.]|nr:NAD(P)(+) transhydrogenase (Re/Si-specific) subunit alpha [Bauldia sp.]
MKIAVPAEHDEPRVAATPETVKKFAGLGATVTVEKGAGIQSLIPDTEYQAVGATIAPDASSTVRDADIVLKVRRPTEAELLSYKPGALVVATMDPYGHEAAVRALAAANVTAFAMEFMPRITRAQSMDVLSSQA